MGRFAADRLFMPASNQKLLTGAVARRIVAWANVGDHLKKGERFGMIRFGSRTEVFLPLNTEVLVKAGDHVLGGSTIIARLPDSVGKADSFPSNPRASSPSNQ